MFKQFFLMVAFFIKVLNFTPLQSHQAEARNVLIKRIVTVLASPFYPDLLFWKLSLPFFLVYRHTFNMQCHKNQSNWQKFLKRQVFLVLCWTENCKKWETYLEWNKNLKHTRKKKFYGNKKKYCTEIFKC